MQSVFPVKGTDTKTCARRVTGQCLVVVLHANFFIFLQPRESSPPCACVFYDRRHRDEVIPRAINGRIMSAFSIPRAHCVQVRAAAQDAPLVTRANIA